MVPTILGIVAFTVNKQKLLEDLELIIMSSYLKEALAVMPGIDEEEGEESEEDSYVPVERKVTDYSGEIGKKT